MSCALGRSRCRIPVGSCGSGSKTISGRRREKYPSEGWGVRYSDGSRDSGIEIFSLKYCVGDVP